MSAEKGERLFKARCAQCHTLQSGAPNKMGPNLWGIVDRQAGTLEGYSYTSAMRDSKICWSEESLFEFLDNPKRKVRGTKMAFAGIKSEEDKLDVIAFLKSGKEIPFVAPTAKKEKSSSNLNWFILIGVGAVVCAGLYAWKIKR